jgi:hypothetical protein
MTQDSQPAPHRHLVTLPKGSKVALAYGCSHCHWRYDPRGVSEVYANATLLAAQFFFGIHDCHKFKPPNPNTPELDHAGLE